MDVFPKFVVVRDEEEGGPCIIIAKCTYHRELVTDVTKVMGGGWWTLDRDNKCFTLYGESDEFGKVSDDVLMDCILSRRIFTNKSLFSKIREDYTVSIK